MKAALLTALKTITIRDVPDPVRRADDEVLLAVDVVGVCGSDVHYYKTGRIGSLVVEFPFVLGHEFSATVLEVGPRSDGLAVGDRVAVDPLVSCGTCDQCRAGRPHTCRNQAFLGCPHQRSGALCERIVMPASCCCKVPDAVSAVQAALVEPLSIGIYAVRLAGEVSGAAAAVLGSGPIGLCTLAALKAAGAGEVFCTDRIDARLDVARRMGAGWTGNPDKLDVVADLLARRPLGLPWVFECAGEPQTYDQALELLGPGGTLLAVGIPEGNLITFSMEQMRRKELRVQNVRRQNDCIADAVGRVADGTIDVDPLATHHFSLAETAAAFDLVAGYRDGVVKAMVHISGN